MSLHLPSTHELAEDLQSLEKDVRDLLGNHLKTKDSLQCLNLACGRADETGVLANILSEKSTEGHIQGLDLRAPEIRYANELWKGKLEKAQPEISCDFRVGRADKISQWNELEDPDLVFIRHQNYWFDPKAWVKLYDQALHKLKQDGVMVITSYYDKEHELARNVLTSLGAIEVEHRFNPDSRVVKDSPIIEKSVDRHISVFVRA